MSKVKEKLVAACLCLALAALIAAGSYILLYGIAWFFLKLHGDI